MMNKQKVIRIAVSSALLLTVVAAGVTMYRTGAITKQAKDNQQEEQQMEEDTSLSEMAQAGDESVEQEETADVTTNQALVENTEEISEQVIVNDEMSVDTAESQENSTETQANVTEAQTNSAEETLAEAAPVLNFNEDSSILWPVSGEVLIDYSMDATTYFKTLDQYKYNRAVMLGAEVGEPVQAAATGTVLSIYENEETGTTMVVDLGNGYQSVYGQLKDILAEVGQTVEAGTIIGYINDPTKYYVEEGANLYFAMTKDEIPVDPMVYLETVNE